MFWDFLILKLGEFNLVMEGRGNKGLGIGEFFFWVREVVSSLLAWRVRSTYGFGVE